MWSSDWPHGRAKIGKSVGHPKKLFQVSPHTDAPHQIGLFTCAIPPQMWYTAQAPRRSPYQKLSRNSAVGGDYAVCLCLTPFPRYGDYWSMACLILHSGLLRTTTTEQALRSWA